ncbi:MAG: hypothetical protein JSY10_29355, partial [Paenibacillus sp.]|nr:hypothetical protein [Paenibacillus sp.]
GRSAYTKSAGNIGWAREQLVKALIKGKEAEYVAALAMGLVPGAVGKTKGTQTTQTASSMFGANGTQVTSKTVWKEQGSKARIDVENPNPGQRPGQIHYQDANNKKYLFDPKKGLFVETNGKIAPKSVNKMLENSEFLKKLNVGLTKYLGESPFIPK